MSWVGVGIGREMKGGLMFVVYASEDGHGELQASLTWRVRGEIRS